MTVAELIAELQKLPRDAIVMHVPCDEYDSQPAAISVDIGRNGTTVMIGREWL